MYLNRFAASCVLCGMWICNAAVTIDAMGGCGDGVGSAAIGLV